MCLAIPGKIIEIDKDNATIDYNGIKKQAKIILISPKIGDYVLVHAGFAIEILKKNKNENDTI
ncbi:MAG: HypC/HybG/HupF family hydrogenase formation chaperone [DPANN group archaeon]|nr:HypC/HybG/HupF family hydrogenase formation chaperone [DPANN group archaeon]